MYFYKDSDDLFHVDDDLFSPGNHVLKVYNNETVVSLEEVETGKIVFGPIEIIHIQKENDSYYSDLSELLSEIKNFFQRITVPGYTDLDTWHKIITDTTFNEGIANLPAKFLPRVFQGDGTGYYSKDIGNPFSSDIFIFYIDFDVTSVPTVDMSLFNQNVVGAHFDMKPSNTTWKAQVYDGVNIRQVTLTFVTLPLETRVYRFKIIQEKTGSLSIYENNILLGASTDVVNNSENGSVEIGHRGVSLTLTDDVQIISTKLYSDLAETNLVFEYYPNGSPYLYDVSGNNKHLTGVSISDANKGYSLEGSLYTNENGYSLWEHTTADPIQVPVDIDGNDPVIGNNLIPAASSSFETDGTAYWSAVGGVNTWDSVNKNLISTSNDSAPGTYHGINKSLILTIGQSTLVTFMAKSADVTSQFTSVGNNGDLGIVESNPPLSAEWQLYSFVIVPNSGTCRIYAAVTLLIGESIELDDIIIQELTIPNDYTKTRDVLPAGNKWNMADALVDFEAEAPILQCDTTGGAYVNQIDAYGLVFDGVCYSKGTFYLYFINDVSNVQNNGYRIALYNNQFYLQKMIGGTASGTLFSTSASYTPINTDYRILVWRNGITDEFVTGAIDTFAVYIQGKVKPITTNKYTIPNLAEMELVDVSGGSGTNPVLDNTYTTSSYLVTNFETGEQISKVNLSEKYVSPYEFTVNSGSYSIIDDSANEIFNRLNAIRQTAASRAADDYDASHPYRYHINEIADPRVYDTYFEAAYKDRLFGKVVLDSTDLIRYDEQLNYATQKTETDLLTVEEYCGITDIYP